VFTVFGQDYGLSEGDCLKIGCAFGGGMGRQQLTCGAVTGALIALGLRYGKGAGESDSKKDETYQKAREFFSEFTRIHGSTSCRELLQDLDMNDPEDHREIINRDLFRKNCERYVVDALGIVEGLI
jgi:C_GCAxxG_C_C family probable redox protein